MEQRNQHRSKKRKKSNNRLAFIAVAAVLALYLGGRIVSAFDLTYETTPAVHVDVNDSFSAVGWFFRDEIPVARNTAGGAVKHIAYSGERVQKDAPLAAVYTDEAALVLSRELAPLENRIALLDTALQTEGDSSDAAKLDRMVILGLQQLATRTKAGAGPAIANAASSLRTLSLRRAAGELDTGAVAAERSALVAEQSSLERQLAGRSVQLTAPSSGYYSEVVDGYESVLTPDALRDLSLETFRRSTADAKAVDDGRMLGKIIQGFRWYLVAEIPVEQASTLRVGQQLRVNFTAASLEAPVTVDQIVEERNSETALLVLEGTTFNSEMVSMREQPIEIIRATYSGLRVPKEAVRVMDHTDSEGKVTSQTGVFILSGSFSKFKIIHTLYEADKYYVVEQSATNADMLVEQDQIVVRGRNLQNNMVVNT
ncbi:MAG: HlyD family efflux transporter periplasmic adaptor subunit [Eubacteriales bacterium]|nr:HlyD family efflux transporter periplasmic adaptor subunit [Eubacteriales bacterium]